MDQLPTYLMSIIAIALLCALGTRLVSGATTGAAVKLLSGILLALAILAPVTSWHLDSIGFALDDLRRQGEQLASEGSLTAQKEIEAGICSAVATYISDKADSLGVQLEVTVELDGFTPCAVSLRGAVSPYIKSTLERTIQKDLGISKEAQHWIS